MAIKDIKSIDLIITKDDFPFNRMILFNNEYLITSRDGYFFVFKSEEIVNKILMKENNSLKGFESVVNKSLVGLSIINNNENDPYKKYGIDTSTICFCDSPSIYIDTFSKELVIFNYCDINKTINKLKDKEIYKIHKIEVKGNTLLIVTNSMKLSFEKIKNVPIYKMQLEGSFPKKNVGNDLKKIYTYEPAKFKKADCENFDG